MEQNTRSCYLGNCIARNPDGTVKIDSVNICIVLIVNPNVPDVADIKLKTSLSVNLLVKGIWLIKRMFPDTLKNHKDIDRLVKEYW